ncbi:HAD family hydrolase [Paracoccus marinaquae]|uniref:HAD family hydrolase n=1 Tax=Paracoccus marinaquae TaxID=2841926 RepID=UPI0020901A52|nr:HAD-IA family hydrolase [Paracoccus marinaquae]
MEPGLIIFDCDGVIADSEILSAEVLIDQLAALEIGLTAEDVRRDFLGRSFPTVAATIRERFGRPLPDDFEAAYRRRLLDRFEHDLRPTPGLAAMLDRLQWPACVATSSSPERVGRTLDLLDLARRFGPHVFTASQVARGKPAPDLFLFAAARMGVAPARTVVVEDSPPGIAAAEAAGMAVLHYRGGAHLKGTAAPASVRSFDNWAEFPQLLKDIQQGAALS